MSDRGTSLGIGEQPEVPVAKTLGQMDNLVGYAPVLARIQE